MNNYKKEKRYIIYLFSFFYYIYEDIRYRIINELFKYDTT